MRTDELPDIAPDLPTEQVEEWEPLMSDPCEHDPAHYSFGRYYTTDMVRIHIRCERCGALRTERRPPQTIVEHLRCLNQSLRDVGGAIATEIRRAR